MLKYYLLTFFLFVLVFANGQKNDMTWWNEQHGWEEGMPSWRSWMKITPGYLGPNALPVPEMKRGKLEEKTEFELTASNHFHNGDPTQDISGRAYIPFAGNKIAIEMYGVIFEHFAFSEEIRNERISRIEDGKGNTRGDLYFSTLVQISRNRKFPNTLFRFATKTASGGSLAGARYSDSPGYFMDLSFSKDLGQNETGLFRPIVMLGFYTWQTNDEFNLQNDAFLYALGIDFEKRKSLFTASWSGYSGYKDRRDKPMQLNFGWRRDLKKTAMRIQYHHGLRDWEYKTIRISYIWKLNPVN
ncbi:MAG: hypothetical protein R3182_00785 [Draconibacterium sp.]|nr:hypothetical protein [Draconibacterium sp.]